MAAFLGEIAFLAGILVIAAGLLVLHRAAADPRPRLLRIAGVVLLAGGIGTAICTGYYFLKYQIAGELEHPYPMQSSGIPMMQGGPERMHMRDMMHGGEARDRPRMETRPGMERPVAAPVPEPSQQDDHEAHH
jgi:hypothetical protein